MEFIKENLWTILIVLNYVIAISAAITVLFKKINPTKTLSYILILVVFPFFGILIYYLFGQEYRKNKIFNRKNVLNQKVVKELEDSLSISKRELGDIEKKLDEKSKLIKLIHTSERSKLTMHNKVDVLWNGEEKFPMLIEDLKAAKHHIHLEYYIWRDDNIGMEVIDILCSKAEEGVSVKMIFDAVGSKISAKVKRKMRKSGVLFEAFMPVRFPRFTGKMNYRDHRKIVVIDGNVGYVGGINISDNYINKDGDEGYWRDTHLRIEGESVKPLQILFLTTWDFVSKPDLKVHKDLFPETEIAHKTMVQIAASGPDTDWANIMEAIFTAITNAEKYIYITTPYFIPNDEILAALQIASKSGLDVKIILPKKSDSFIAENATNSYIDDLLRADIKVYQYTRGFIHTKSLVVDDVFCTVGTANLDYRSFNINFEVNALIYDETTSATLKSHFLNDLKYAELLDKDQWKNRPRFNRVSESVCRLLAPLL